MRPAHCMAHERRGAVPFFAWLPGARLNTAHWNTPHTNFLNQHTEQLHTHLAETAFDSLDNETNEPNPRRSM
jgi:hypothetical protein